MKRFGSLVLLAVLAVGLTAGCGSLRKTMGTKPVDYKSARQLPPLKIPPDLIEASRQDTNPFPPVPAEITPLGDGPPISGQALVEPAGVRPEPGLSAAVTPQAPRRARLGRSSDGVATLALEERFERAWVEIGTSLDSMSALSIQNEDPDAGVFVVQYQAPPVKKEKQGFFKRLFRRDKKSPEPVNYFVTLTPAGSLSLVTVNNAEGVPDRTPAGEQILAMLHGQLRQQ